ncbi:MAG: hypothetical protein GY757_43025 [bacterium]|nr:hypothetical protein [bacterium]
MKEAGNYIAIGNGIALLGSILLSTGLFLPWASIGGSFSFTPFGIHKTGAYSLLILAVLLLVTSLAGLLLKKDFAVAITVTGFLALIVSVYAYIDILSEPKVWANGFIISGAGIILVLMATCFMGLNLRKRVKESA